MATSVLWKTVGNQLFTLVEGPESSVSIDDKGHTTAVMNFTTRRLGALHLAMAQLRHPYIPALMRNGIDINYVAPDWAEVAISYEGIVLTPETEPGISVKYELQATTGDAPIETHEEFPKFGGRPVSGSKVANNKGAIFDETGKFVAFAVQDPKGKKYYKDANSDMAGVKSYLMPSVIYTEVKTYNSTARGNLQFSLEKLGKISSPPRSAMLPGLPGAMDWLLIGYDASDSGEGLTVKRSWRASGYRGWNQVIYAQ